MKSFSRILFYLQSQKRNIVLYFVFNLLSILFSLVSLTMLAPFLQLLFGTEKLVTVSPEISLNDGASLNNYIKYIISQIIIKYNDKTVALAFICVIIITTVFFKNLFTLSCI